MASKLIAAAFIIIFTSGIALADKPTAITGFKRDTVGFFGPDKKLIQRVPVDQNVRSSLLNKKVSYDSSTGMFKLPADGTVVFLSRRDIETSQKVGTSGASLCGMVATAKLRDGSSGSGANCR